MAATAFRENTRVEYRWLLDASAPQVRRRAAAAGRPHVAAHRRLRALADRPRQAERPRLLGLLGRQTRPDSVLDDHAEARWVDPLFVGDNSAFANCLGGPNPTLTNQALAIRTAERIFSKLLRRRSVGGQ